MKKLLAAIVVTTAIGLTMSPGIADGTETNNVEVTHDDNGGFESVSQSEFTSPSGTHHASEKKVDVDVDDVGLVSRKVESYSLSDPKGLLNREITTLESSIEEKPEGGYKEKTTRRLVDADGTNITVKSRTDVAIDEEGNIIENTVRKKTVDPEGVFNEQTSTTHLKAVNGDVVAIEREER